MLVCFARLKRTTDVALAREALPSATLQQAAPVPRRVRRPAPVRGLSPIWPMAVWLIAVCLSLWLLPTQVLAQEADTSANSAGSAKPNDAQMADSSPRIPPVSGRYTVSVLTMSPGDPLFSRFGHNALLIRDRRTASAKVYNWGTFSFNQPDLIGTFLKGRLRYWLSVSDLESTLAAYDSQNRSVIEQELALTEAQTVELVQAVRKNARPENRHYRYDYYRDNCSTRVRDLLDGVLDGKLHELGQAPAETTYRDHTLRLVADDVPAFTGLDLAMGSHIDQPLPRWAALFVPGELQSFLGEVSVKTPTGNEPLVRRERTLVSADRTAPPNRPPNRQWHYLAVGFAFGLALALALPRPLASRARWVRAMVAFPLALVLTLLGLLGCLLVFLWLATDHIVAHANENVLQVSPLALVLGAVFYAWPFRQRWAQRALAPAAIGLAALSWLGLILQAAPGFEQENGRVIALMLPLWSGLAVAAYRASRRGQPGSEDRHPPSQLSPSPQ